MLIVIYSSRFFPMVGGIESVVLLLAQSFVEMGNDVVLVTSGGKAAINDQQFKFKVLRNPTWVKRFQLARKSSVLLHNSISLTALFPDILFAWKFYAIHHTWYDGRTIKEKLGARVKIWICNFVKNIYISKEIKSHVNKNGKIIPNPYDNNLFRIKPEILRIKDLVFLGRLVSDKGCDFLIKAVKQIHQNNVHVNLTIIGEGEERQNLERLAVELDLAPYIFFMGTISGEKLADELNRHKIMVIPSLWNEPFGIVALEGIASGCVVIGSDGGGLKEAIGKAGLIFQKGNLTNLVSCLQEALKTNSGSNFFRYKTAHLQNHSSHKIAQHYIDLFSRRAH